MSKCAQHFCISCVKIAGRTSSHCVQGNYYHGKTGTNKLIYFRIIFLTFPIHPKDNSDLLFDFISKDKTP